MKYKVICALILCTLLFISLSIAEQMAYYEQQNAYVEGTGVLPNTDDQAGIQSVLPSSLITIEDSAFEGTALTNVVLQNKVEDIGDNAFSNIDKLFSISISKKTERISQNAFSGSENIRIFTETSSYAKHWAQRQGVPYVIVPFFTAATEKSQDGLILPSTRAKQITVRRIGSCFAEKKENQTGRPDEEIKLPRFNGNASEIVQSRYFP